MENNRELQDEIEIDLGEIFAILLGKAWIILAAAIVCGVVGFVVSSFFMTPMYESSTSVYILNKKESGSLTVSDTQLATQLTKDYEVLITSRTVLENVIEELDLDMSYQQLAKMISVSNSKDTRIITITVTNDNPSIAREIANTVRDISSNHIKGVMEIEAVNVVDKANLPEDPSSPNVIKLTMLGAVAGFILAVGVIVVIYLLDDTIKTSDDIEKYLGVTCLAMIPLNESLVEDKKKRKKSNKQKSSKTTAPSV